MSRGQRSPPPSGPRVCSVRRFLQGKPPISWLTRVSTTHETPRGPCPLCRDKSLPGQLGAEGNDRLWETPPALLGPRAHIPQATHCRPPTSRVREGSVPGRETRIPSAFDTAPKMESARAPSQDRGPPRGLEDSHRVPARGRQPRRPCPCIRTPQRWGSRAGAALIPAPACTHTAWLCGIPATQRHVKGLSQQCSRPPVAGW